MTDDRVTGQPSSRGGSEERKVRLPKQPTGDRRSAIRYPLALHLRYSVVFRRKGPTEIGSGQTIDLSSSGVRFTASGPLRPDLQVYLSVDWPVPLDGGVELQLILSGTVVRTRGTETALRISRHELRTRGPGLKLA